MTGRKKETKAVKERKEAFTSGPLLKRTPVYGRPLVAGHEALPLFFYCTHCRVHPTISIAEQKIHSPHLSCASGTVVIIANNHDRRRLNHVQRAYIVYIGGRSNWPGVEL